MDQQPQYPVQGAPAAYPFKPNTPPKQWKAGLFDCFNDVGNLIYVLCFGPCAFASRASRLRKGDGWLCFCCYGGALPIRGEIRMRANIEGTACDDCLTIWFCPCCAAVQEQQEINELERAGLL
ncbi:PLAC8 family-domain-containing protein [Blyttiomyces helicus]|uniref:PLAC8 family-domain-containing protein n=1 Tax=Blyttiomyces helicus TaxID=388810 RepID=A0A4P9WLR2_9FUNG|nr:PLAC8 family-domain-containing protein [Blyttiomyces helicus]|eukprot:RKO92080.1 PLAC8 family-domain-containing protein [Blyttiomyces helicus]